MSYQNKRIFLSPPHMSGRELDFVQKAFASNWIAPVGPDVDAFEKEFCHYIGSPYGAAVSSGTAALHLALILSGIGEGDEVLCSTFTFAGTINPIIYQKAQPIFVDSDIQTWNIDPCLFEKAIVERLAKGKCPKAAIIVHLYGQSADIDAIESICQKYGIALIEDAAESVGAFFKGKHTGTIGKIGIYSFNGNKIITTSGGGMIVSEDKATIDKARFYATQARDTAPHYQHTHIGYNYRMSNIVAAIGRGQTTVIEDRVARKREIFARYNNEFEGLPGIQLMPEEIFGSALSRSNRWLTCITIDPQKAGVDRETIRLALEAENIESRPLWKPMHLQPVFASFPVFASGISEKLFNNGLCLPSGSSLTEDDQNRIINICKKILCP